MLGHETQVEQREIFRVGVLDGDELGEHVLSVGAESGVGRNGHETLETLEQDGVGSVLDVAGADLGADAVVRGDQDLAVVLHEGGTARVLLDAAQEAQDGHLQEGVLHTADFVVGVEVADDLPVDLRDLGHEVDDFLHMGVAEGQNVLQEGEGAQQNSVVLVVEWLYDGWHEVRNKLWSFL